jgi:hypothetical protein
LGEARIRSSHRLLIYRRPLAAITGVIEEDELTMGKIFKQLFGRTAFGALILALAMGSVPAAFAQETTGGIEGTVRDSSGAVLPGATVEATGPSGTVSAVTDERGEFRFPRLPSGRYAVSTALSGFNGAKDQVNLTVGNVARVEFRLALSGIAETVEVTSVTPAIDMSSPATATNISRERIELIPRGRDFTDVVAQAAGASDESQAGGISIDGSSGSENRFVIDGIDTTSPQEGVSAVPLRADFLEEIQVKSAGYAAEFGGSTGGVINVITRSGTNNWHGGVLAEFQDRSWGGSERPLLRDSLTSSTFTYINPPKDDETRIDPGFFLGGPIVRNRLWFFGSYQPGIRSTDRTVNFSNGVTNTFNQDFRVDYGTVNVTGKLGSKVLFRGGGNFSPYETERARPSSCPSPGARGAPSGARSPGGAAGRPCRRSCSAETSSSARRRACSSGHGRSRRAG